MMKKYNFAVNKIPVSASPINSGVDEQEQVDSSAVADRATSLAGAGEVNPNETLQAAEVGDKSLVFDAKNKINKPSATVFRQALQEGTASLEDLQRNFYEMSEKEEVQADLQDYYIETGILVEGVDYSATELRFVTNRMIAEQKFRDRIAEIEDDTGFFGKASDWLDRYIIRQFPIGAVEDLTSRATRKGKELLQAQIEMSPKEYSIYMDNYIQELSEEGVFKSDNFFAMMDGYEEAVNAGYDPYDELKIVFGGLDLLPLAALATKGVAGASKLGKLKTLDRADHAITRVTALEGQKAGGEVAEKIIKTTGSTDNVAKTKAGPAAFDEGSSIVRPSSSKVLEITENNNLWRKIKELDTKGAFGRVYKEGQLDVAADQIVKNFAKRTSNKFNNYVFTTDVANNPIARIDFGNTKTGLPYKREADAKKAFSKTDLPEGEVVPVDPNDSTKGYVIRVDSRVDSSSLADPFDTNAVEFGVLRGAFTKVFGSNAALDDEYLSALANMGEAGLTKVKDEATKFEKAITKIPTDSKKAITRVFKNLRDGPDAEVTQGYTPSEFAQKFKEQHPQGKYPTQADMDAYNAIVEFEDAGWLMRANEVLNKFVKQGYWSLEIKGTKTIGKRVDNLPEGEDVLNASTGLLVDDVTKIKTGIWELESPLDNTIRYITNPIDAKVLDHADVMGFNAGGRRINPNAKYFAVFDGDRPRAFLTAFSEKQAKQAVDQFNAIANKVRELGGDLKALKATDELDDLVRKNNDWNTDLGGFDDFAQLALSKGWPIDVPVSYKERGGEVVNLSRNSPLNGSRWDDYVKVELNRSNDTLMDFGGGETYNIDPVSAIMEEFANATTHYTHRAYTYNASAAWVKRASQSGSGVRLSAHYAPNDYINQIQHAEVLGTNATARALKTQQGVIRRRLKLKGPVERMYDRFGQQVIESVFDKTGYKINSIDPTNALLNVGFQSAFGFLNISQFFMQGMHATTVMALSPVQGIRGAASVIPLRMALNAGSPAAEKLAIKRLAKSMGETEEVMSELVEYTRTAGRDIIGADTMELGTGVSFGISNWGTETMIPSAVKDSLSRVTSGGRKVLDIGLVPFNQGERLSRMTAINTAFFEFKKKFPNVSALSDEGRRWITSREQTLTFNMTASSRPLFQSGLMKVPTQWLSYSFRALESVVVGRGLSVGERARLAAVLGPMYGLTGLGMGQAADYFAEKYGIEDPNQMIGLKYGFIDYFIAEATPAETALSARLAPITAFTDLYNKIAGGEATALEVVGGPSGQISSGIFESFAKAASDLYNGHTVSLQESALQVLRQPSGLDNIAKGIGILNNGFYRSKTGTILPIEMKTSDALINFMGFSPLEVSEFYSQKSGKFNSDKKVRAFAKEQQKEYQRALQIWREDPQRGLKMFDEIHTRIALSGFSPGKQMEIRQGLKDHSNSDVYYLVRDLIERDRMNSALITEQLLGGN